MKLPASSALPPRIHSIVILALLTIAICFSERLTAQELHKTNFTGFKTDFSQGTTLSKSEIAVLLRLAKKAGVTNVIEITSYDSGVVIKGSENFSGRQVSFVPVNVETGPTSPWRNKEWLLYSEGNYRVTRGDVRTNTLTLFKVHDRTIRVRLDSKITVNQADRIMSDLLAKKIRFLNEHDKKSANIADLTTPDEISLSKDGKWCIGFSPDRSSSLGLFCDIDEDGLLVTSSIFSVE
jgi:hypothetical protein